MYSKDGELMKLSFNGGSYKVALPKKIVENVLKWKHNDDLTVEVEKNKVVITRSVNNG